MASNNADMVCDGPTCDVEVTDEHLDTRQAVRVKIFVEDKNDNLPR